MTALRNEEVPLCPPFALRSVYVSIARIVWCQGGGKGAMEPRPSSPIPKERAIRVTDVGTPQKEETSPRGDSNGKESPHPPETSMEGV
jgi:hypothetical protein